MDMRGSYESALDSLIASLESNPATQALGQQMLANRNAWTVPAGATGFPALNVYLPGLKQ